jgi:hypothetical protein
MPHPNGHRGRWQKKPVDIDALQFEIGWTTADDLIDFFGESSCALAVVPPSGLVSSLKIYTLEGEMKVSNGDYIIKGVAGEFYPCKPDIFEQTYRPISDKGSAYR